LTAALVDQFCCSVKPEKEEILDGVLADLRIATTGAPLLT